MEFQVESVAIMWERSVCAAGSWLSVRRHTKKGTRKNSSWEEGINALYRLIGLWVTESLGGGIDSRKEIDLWLLQVKYPILLPKYSALTKLIVQGCHNDCKHLGIAATLCKLRYSGFPCARQSINHYTDDCFVCRKYNALSFRYPRLTNLPKNRVNLIRPFLHIGVDFTGHLWIQTEELGYKKEYQLEVKGPGQKRSKRTYRVER